jgi:hypothetical protein
LCLHPPKLAVSRSNEERVPLVRSEHEDGTFPILLGVAEPNGRIQECYLNALAAVVSAPGALPPCRGGEVWSPMFRLSADSYSVIDALCRQNASRSIQELSYGWHPGVRLHLVAEVADQTGNAG